MDNQPKVAIVILNWNGFDDTVECLESLKHIDYTNYKIVLVDNDSKNNEGGRLYKMFPYVQYMKNPVNRGFAGGNNDAMNWAINNDFDYIVNLNNDTTVEKDWLSRLVSSLIKNKADFASSMILFYEDKDKVCSYNDILLPDGSAIALNRNSTYSKSEKIEKIFSACGAGSIFSCRCLKDVAVNGDQCFDELYFAYYEDVDLCTRLHAKNYKGIVDYSAIIYHKHSKSAGRYSDLKIFNSEKNRILNEIFNFPFYLVFTGEIFFVYKLIFSFFSLLLGKGAKTKRFIKNKSVFKLTFLLIKARLWVLGNLPLILQKRKERRDKHLINRGIFKYFNWNLSNFNKF